MEAGFAPTQEQGGMTTRPTWVGMGECGCGCQGRRRAANEGGQGCQAQRRKRMIETLRERGKERIEGNIRGGKGQPTKTEEERKRKGSNEQNRKGTEQEE